MVDIRTLILAAALSNLVLAALLLLFGRSAPLAPAMRIWLGSRLVLAGAWGLLWGRDVLPDAVSIWFGNVLLFSGLALELVAAMIFCGLRVRLWVATALWSTWLIVWTVTCLAGTDASGRIAVASVIGMVCYFSTAIVLLRHATADRRLAWAIGGANLLLALVLAGRTAAALTADFTLTTVNTVQVMTFLPMFVFTLVSSYGFLLLSKADADRALLRLATRDDLTDALNRRAFLDQAESQLHLARRLGHPLGLLMLDLDHFKRINDRHGHATGDTVLAAFGRVCHDAVRETDLFGRLGGEEFAVLLPGADEAGVPALAERIRRAVVALRLTAADGAPVPVTVSIGAVCLRPDESLSELMSRADDLLYAAKQQGRDRVSVERPSLVVAAGLPGGPLPAARTG